MLFEIMASEVSALLLLVAPFPFVWVKLIYTVSGCALQINFIAVP